jgi:hypothetical protein
MNSLVSSKRESAAADCRFKRCMHTLPLDIGKTPLRNRKVSCAHNWVGGSRDLGTRDTSVLSVFVLNRYTESERTSWSRNLTENGYDEMDMQHLRLDLRSCAG